MHRIAWITYRTRRYAGTRTQVGRSNQILAALLAHLAEVEARGLHRSRACASLYTYCIYELRFSEEAALRRCHAARFARRFPVIFAHLAAGEIHLTAVLMLGPQLTEGNHVEVLARAKHRTKREIAALVRELDPLPDVPARVESLGPARPPAALGKATYERFSAALEGPVRELPEGQRPKDWGDDFGAGDLVPGNAIDADDPAGDGEERRGEEETNRACSLEGHRYKVQFTASQEYVNLLDEARDLLGHAVPRNALDEIHVRAMRLLVAKLKKRKYAILDANSRLGASSETDEPGVMLAAVESTQEQVVHRPGRQRTRCVPAPVRRAVAERDGERCAYVDAEGRRCRETHALELHHIEPFARGGPATISNLSLRCRAHNSLAAEEDFGEHFMAEKAAASRFSTPE